MIAPVTGITGMYWNVLGSQDSLCPLKSNTLSLTSAPATDALNVLELLQFAPQGSTTDAQSRAGAGLGDGTLDHSHVAVVARQATAAMTRLVLERLADTVLGASIAWLFSYVLPAWERGQIPALVRRSVQAQQQPAGQGSPGNAAIAPPPGTMMGAYGLSQQVTPPAAPGATHAAAKTSPAPADLAAAAAAQSMRAGAPFGVAPVDASMRDAIAIDPAADARPVADEIERILGDEVDQPAHAVRAIERRHSAAQNFHALNQTPAGALNQVPPEKLVPGSKALDKLMARYR